MKLEIERRFLVDQKRLPSLPTGKLLTQGYLSKEIDKTSPIVRVRTAGSNATLTIKGYRSEVTKAEFEYPIPLKDAEVLLKECIGQVQKVRYLLKVSGKVWSIDFYEGENFPLIVAEIELKSEKEKFEKPLWVTKEVTDEPRFHAYQLALKPFNSWKKSVNFR